MSRSVGSGLGPYGSECLVWVLGHLAFGDNAFSGLGVTLGALGDLVHSVVRIDQYLGASGHT